MRTAVVAPQNMKAGIILGSFNQTFKDNQGPLYYITDMVCEYVDMLSSHFKSRVRTAAAVHTEYDKKKQSVWSVVRHVRGGGNYSLYPLLRIVVLLY